MNSQSSNMDQFFLFIPHSPLQYEVYNYFAQALKQKTDIIPLGIDLGNGLAQLKAQNNSIEKWICLEERIRTFGENHSDGIIKSFEEKHGIEMSKDWYIDRAINHQNVTYDQVKKLTSTYIKVIQEIFEEFAIYGAISEKLFMPQRIVHYVAQEYGKKHLNPIGDRFFQRLYFEDGIDGWNWDEAVYVYRANSSIDDIPEIVEDVYKKVTDKAFKKIFTVHGSKGKKNQLNPNIQSCEGMSLYCDFIKNQLNKNIIGRIRRRSMKQFDTLFKKRFFDDEVPDKPYVLYLYHMQPEYTVDGIATYHSNQTAIIEELAKRLPAEIPIVVKENPKNEVNILESLGKYNVLNKLPNVFLVPKSADSHQLIKGSRVIFTLTGTVGLEGLLFKKPVVCLGNIFYQNFKYCQKVSSVEEASQQIKKRFYSDNQDIESDEEHPYRVLHSIYKGSYPGVMFNAFAPNVHRSDSNVEVLKEAFLKEIDKIKEK